MDTYQTALVFFYGLSWATVIATTGRYHPFPTAALWDSIFDAKQRTEY